MSPHLVTGTFVTPLLAAPEPSVLAETMLGNGLALTALSLTLLILVLTGTFGRSGFTLPEALALILACLAGSAVPAHWLDLGVATVRSVTFDVNALGVGVPLLVSLKVALSDRLEPSEAAVGLLVAAFVAYEISAFDPSRGIVVDHFTIVPLVGALLAILVKGPTDRGSPPLAYFYGSMGVLVGADLLRVPEIVQSSTGPVTTALGGAGISDAVFLAGLVAVAMDAAIDFYSEEREREAGLRSGVDA